MSDPIVTPQPSATPVPVAPEVTSTPGLTGLSAPAIAPAQTGPNLARDPGSPVVQAEDRANVAYQKAADIASTPMPAPAGRHASLLAMIQGLTLGMGAFGKSLATEGKEGGIEEVQSVTAARQKQQEDAKEFAITQRNAEIQQQLTIADTNTKQAQNMIYLATLPTDLEERDIKLQSDRLAVTGQQQDVRMKALQDFIATGDMNAYTSTLKQLGDSEPAGQSAINPNGSTPNGAAPNGVPPMAMASWKNGVDAASEAYPNDAQIQQSAAILADPKSTPTQMAMASLSAQNRMKALDAGVASRQKQNAADPLYKFETDPSMMAGQNSSAAIAQLTGIMNSTQDPQAKLRATRLLGEAKAAHTAFINDEQTKDQIQQTIAQGDPVTAGKLLASNTLTVQDLKLRNATPQFIENAVKQAQLQTGGKYNAVQAEAYQHVANSDANTAFFGNVNSLTQTGGTLDQLGAIGKNISQDDFKLLNKTKNWTALETGSGPIASYAATLVGVADDYSKVMGGGVGSDTSRAMVLRILDPNLSPAQRTQAIASVKASVDSQKHARIGNNPFLAAMYGTTPAENSAAPAAAPAAPTGSPNWASQFGGKAR